MQKKQNWKNIECKDKNVEGRRNRNDRNGTENWI